MAHDRGTLRKLAHLAARLEALVLDLNDIRQELEVLQEPQGSPPMRSSASVEDKPGTEPVPKPAIRDSHFQDYPELDEHARTG